MRIIAGDWKRRQLRTPAGDLTRPSADRTRETLFSMLVSRLGTFEGLSVADLFAGSGALGLEALSRGAANCTFVEQDAAALRAIRDNIAAFRAKPQAEVIAGSVMSLGPAKVARDLVLLDPPYGTGAGAVAIERLIRMGWIGEATWVALEIGAKEDAKVRTMDVESERRVGAAKLVLFRWPANAAS